MITTTTSLRKAIAWAAICALLVFAVRSIADEALFEQADVAAAEQRLEDMQHIYEQLLARDANNVRAITGKAAAQAWRGDFAAAQTSYRRALAIEPRNVEAHVGLGYAYAWAGQYTEAHTSFHRALNIDAMHLGARKGIAYSYFWAGENELALESFDLAQSIAADDAEISEALGHVNLSLGRSRDAVRDFDRALQLEPGRESAQHARRDAFNTAPALELNLRAGSTSGAGSGLRSIEVAHWTSPVTRFAFRYDNSLGLDNVSIADRGSDAPGYFVSAQQSLGSRFQASAEIGRRDLPSAEQDIFLLQGAYRNHFGVGRLGLQLGRHSDGYTDELIFGSYNFQVGSRWRVEPTLYLSQSGAAKDDEWRTVIAVEYPLGAAWKLGGHLGTGHVSSSTPEFDGDTALAGVWAETLLADQYTLQLAARREESPANDFTIVELGLTYRVPGN